MKLPVSITYWYKWCQWREGGEGFSFPTCVDIIAWESHFVSCFICVCLCTRMIWPQHCPASACIWDKSGEQDGLCLFYFIFHGCTSSWVWLCEGMDVRAWSNGTLMETVLKRADKTRTSVISNTYQKFFKSSIVCQNYFKIEHLVRIKWLL